jgi:hypothetical protein
MKYEMFCKDTLSFIAKRVCLKNSYAPVLICFLTVKIWRRK